LKQVQFKAKFLLRLLVLEFLKTALSLFIAGLLLQLCQIHCVPADRSLFIYKNILFPS